MKTTGIVRRVDDLGRVVIPKEIRSTLGLGAGARVEIYMAKEGIIIKKYGTGKLLSLISVLEEYMDESNEFDQEEMCCIKENILQLRNIIEKNIEEEGNEKC